MQGREQILVYLLRRTNLTYDEITTQFDPDQLLEIYKECKYQDDLDDWKQRHNTASIMAAIANSNRGRQQRTYKASDFVSDPPQREGQQDELTELAQKMGIRTPKGEHYDKYI